MTAAARIRTRTSSSSEAAGASSTTFWCRRCTEHSRSKQCTTFPCRSPEGSPVRGKKLNQHLHVTAEKEWRYPNRPTIQLSLPYLFIADEPVYMSQVPAFMHYRADPLPGTTFGGQLVRHIHNLQASFLEELPPL